MNERRWRIGELAKAAHISVRTLRHYEQVGLLTPAGRTSGDHRWYGQADIERLYRIRALRELGMSLISIRHVINDSNALATLLQAHLQQVELEIARLAHLRERLRTVSHAGNVLTSDALLATLEAMSRVEKHAYVRQHDHTSKDEKQAELRWRRLGDRLRACMLAGIAPSSSEAGTVASEARGLIEAFAEGDVTILQALARLRQIELPDGFAGWDSALMKYLDQALLALGES